MLKIALPSMEFFDSEKEEFIYTEERVLTLEHCLYAIAEWESTWKKPFLVDEKKTGEELLDYVRCMSITDDLPPDVLTSIPASILEEIFAYVDETRSATTITDYEKKPPKKEIVTSEVIYYWMAAAGIPFECDKWHLSRLLKLIEVASIKSNPNQKKMSRREVLAQYAALNAERKSRLGTKG